MGALARIRALYAYVTTGSDHLAPAVMRSERDIFHWCAGVAAGLAGPVGLAYAVLSARKQAADASDPAAAEDAPLDKGFSLSGVAVGWAACLPALAAWGWPGVLAVWAAATLAIAAMILASVGLRR